MTVAVTGILSEHRNRWFGIQVASHPLLKTHAIFAIELNVNAIGVFWICLEWFLLRVINKWKKTLHIKDKLIV